MEIVLDIECDSLNPTTIWCVVAQELGQQKQEVFFEAQEFQTYIHSKAGATLYAHNGISYDFPVLERLWNIELSDCNLRDTLVLSRLANPSRDGGHSLESWGETLGFPKGEHEDWSRFSPEMLEYCSQDVRVTARALVVIKRELGDSINSYAVELEHQIAAIIDQQIKNGWLLDERKCYDLLLELRHEKDKAEAEVHQRFRPVCTKVREIQPKTKQDGTMSVVGLKFLGDNCTQLVGGPLTRVDFPEFNLGSRQQIGFYLQRFGWTPKRFTETGQPIVSEEVLEGVDIPEAQLIARYLMLEKRAAMVNSWLDGADVEGRVHGYVNPIGAVTGRMTHSAPNVAQVTAKGKPYGAELRECWTVPEGYKLVGMDADGLELRMLAHYMDDADYIKTVCEGNKDAGTDVHTCNQRAAGLATRDQAKTFIYAFLYGAGDAKIGTIVGGGKTAGKRLKETFLRGTPSLERLRERVSKAARRGWLQGLDGRRIIVRSEHAALNTLLQGAGAVVMKQALVMATDLANREGLNFKWVGNIHDEVNAEVLEAHAERFARICEQAMREAGEFFNLRCPLAGTSHVGRTWLDVH